MRRLKLGAFAVVAVTAFCGAHAVAQNLLVNPGFEDPITSDGPPFVGFWEGFQGGGALASRDTVMPRSGAGHLSVVIDNANNTFAGAFQDVVGLAAGQLMDFSLWHKTTTLPYNLVSEMRIEWRNSVSDTEVSRTPNSLPVPTLDYVKTSVVAPVPAGADSARVVYAIQSFTNTALPDIGTVYVDDASVTRVPEPATLGLFGIALLASLGMWRRRWA